MLGLLVGMAPAAVATQPPSNLLPEAKKVGEGTLSFAFWDLYNAALYAPQGTLNASRPFVLSIRYLRHISAKDIVVHSVEEMRRQGFSHEQKLQQWQNSLSAIFPDVHDGVVLSAFFVPGKKTVFYRHNQPIGSIDDAEFTQWFANIWLGENSSEPSLRNKLLGRL
jgi:hypothetical protein